MQINRIKGDTAAQVFSSVSESGAAPRRPDGDDDSGSRPHRAGPRGGGLMVQALKQTLSQLGLQPGTSTAGTTDASGSTAANTATSADATPEDGSAALRSDLHALMHALFHAIRPGSSAEAGPGARRGSSPPPDLASALSALATQAAQGQAPTELQEAFQKLAQDLPGSGGGSITLPSFLQTLQQNLGAGHSPQQFATGQSLQLQA